MKLFRFVNGLTVGFLIVIGVIITGSFIGCSEEEAEAIVRITEPSSGYRTGKDVVLLAGEVENNASDQVQISVNGFTKHTANISNRQFSAMVTLDDGENLIEVLVDGAKAQVRVIKTTNVPIVDTGEMVLVPAGEFEMGTDEAEIPQLVQWAKKWWDVYANWFERETPRHTVYLDSFYIDKYEVTNAQYAQFLNEYGKNTDPAGYRLLDIGSPWCLIENVGGTYKPKAGYETHPVVKVSWYGAAAYAQFYGKRLPTEAQWEKAARVGLPKKRFPWGDDDPDGSQCNFADRNTNYGWSNKDADDGYSQTAPVGSYPAYGGLHDMAGNVWEWCADEYDSGYYRISPENNPTGPGGVVMFANDDFTNVNTVRVLRGGSWDVNPCDLRVAHRSGFSPAGGSNYIGFRCVSQD